ncbi:helix-turn-helix domain-containing protein [Xenorhabdus sp. XENO-10]|uniref:Helix-turn-helix domain-containing protein n=1 Tax=Xenorhabdus yunnanensis TaxID=3025878 RepID=A0ABT5LHY9_9GAMM|nr:helix-turn-helix domain-containing protein [Xenorhabdus yunnanensis]MDC9590725.1 helix-turn-helix domain-containing protein [Xenorhabdus yunnanensis]
MKLDWHPADILVAVRKTGISLAGLSRRADTERNDMAS